MQKIFTLITVILLYALWLFIGFCIWMPIMADALGTLLFEITLISTGNPSQMEKAKQNLRFAQSFYYFGFVMIYQFMIDHKPMKQEEYLTEAQSANFDYSIDNKGLGKLLYKVMVFYIAVIIGIISFPYLKSLLNKLIA